MSRYQHTKQHMPVYGFKSASTARKLIALSQGPAPLVLRATIEDETLTEACHARISMKPQTIAGVQLGAWQLYFLVRSPKFAGRYYLVTEQNGQLVCSSREDGVVARCIAAVEQYRQSAFLALAA